MLGKGMDIRVKQINGDVIEDEINKALEELTDNEIIDIKFGKTATQGDWGADALIIYKINRNKEIRAIRSPFSYK